MIMILPDSVAILAVLIVISLHPICDIIFMDLTKIIYWNCRGVSSRDTTTRIFYLMRKFKPVIICLVETRTNDDRLQRFCSKLKSQWNWAAVIVEGYSGGILTI